MESDTIWIIMGTVFLTLFLAIVLIPWSRLCRPFAANMHTVAYVTCPNSSVAEKIASLLVDQKLAACVNIIPSVKSIYSWNGKIEQNEEVLMMIKTRSSLVEKLTESVKANHPYECPEVISVPISSGFGPYLKWISESTLDA